MVHLSFFYNNNEIAIEISHTDFHKAITVLIGKPHIVSLTFSGKTKTVVNKDLIPTLFKTLSTIIKNIVYLS